MNLALLSHEWLVIALGLGLLLADLWVPDRHRRYLGMVAVLGLASILMYSLCAFKIIPGQTEYAFGRMYAMDGLALFFKRFFLLAAMVVLLISIEFSDRIPAGIIEYYSLILFALAGMLFASSANDFTLLFVSLELITVTFYVLTSFQRGNLLSLEAGVKYLIIGALSTAFTVFGIALVYGTSGKLNFGELASVASELTGNRIFLFGLLLVMVGLGFKIAAFPFQIWAPDVYQGAPVPSTAFLAVGSKAAGFVLLLRVLFNAVPGVTAEWSGLLMVVSAITILYGNLCAVPQHNIKRMLGYSSIAHAGYLLLGITAMSGEGRSAILFYLSGYLFTVLAAFTVICLVMRQVEGEEISALAGLHERSPLLALAMTLAMVSLAGVPPLVGFFGKFLLLKSVIAQAPAHPGYYCLAFTALAGVVISLYYYLGVVRAIYWSKGGEVGTITISAPIRTAICGCIAGMLVLGIYPGPLLKLTLAAVMTLH
jgi:proton-translocating NADH-quinone oxidoreductase, chain N